MQHLDIPSMERVLRDVGEREKLRAIFTAKGIDGIRALKILKLWVEMEEKEQNNECIIDDDLRDEIDDLPEIPNCNYSTPQIEFEEVKKHCARVLAEKVDYQDFRRFLIS